MSDKSLPEALTFDDILLVPAYSEVLPKDVEIASRLCRGIALNIPFVSAAMDTVTDGRLAIAIAQEGGIGIIHKNMSIEAQANAVRSVKKFESGVVRNPVTISPAATVAELLNITRAHQFSGVPVVEGKSLVGIVTRRDVRFEADLSKSIASVMTPKDKLITVKEDATRDEIVSKLQANRIEKLLVIDDTFSLRGMITVRDLESARDKPNACKDNAGQLRAGAAVGTGEKGRERATALIASGVDALVVDTAHGHSKGVIDQVKWIKANYQDEVAVIGGNIATADAAIALADAGADGVKVGIGPGSICTTRVVTGIGMPQFSAILQVAEALKSRDVPMIADGGIRYSGDVSKALAAGAGSVMIGSLFAGTEESPGEVELYQGRTYKSYRGMGSLGAMAQSYGSSDRYFQDQTDAEKLVPEGIEGRVPCKGPISAILTQLVGGLRSCMGYTGSNTINELQAKRQFMRVSAASVREGRVHDVKITKEAPNYSEDH